MVAGEASNAQNNVSVQESAQKSGVNFPAKFVLLQAIGQMG